VMDREVRSGCFNEYVSCIVLHGGRVDRRRAIDRGKLTGVNTYLNVRSPWLRRNLSILMNKKPLAKSVPVAR
jgi:hypothetical protein